jgi:hypothetical protein
MENLSGVVNYLKHELAKAQQEVKRFTAALEALGSTGSNGHSALSASARKRISLAQKARWAKVKAGSKPAAGAVKATASAPMKRAMSISARKKIALAQRKRWAKLKAGRKAV